MDIKGVKNGIRSRIIGTGLYVPKSVMSNSDLEKMVDTSDQWIVERTGIRERRIAMDGETTSFMAAKASEKALEMANTSVEEIDIIIVATSTPDMFFPSTACMVQNNLGAKRSFAFDISAACSGFIYALSVSDQYIRSGFCKTALVIGSEVLSTITDWTDRTTCVIFGDGAGAVVLKKSDGERGVLSTHLYSDAKFWDLIYVPGGGSRCPPSEKMLKDRLNSMKMKGNETFKIAVRALEEASREALRYNDISVSDIAFFIPHQANYRIIKAVADRLHISMDNVFINIDRYGNTSSASIPIALDEAVRSNRINDGDIIIISAFGGGLTWGSAAIRW
ncbi:MAG: beta-ketoacyl-ACP synthase III [Nitrospirota bacterium]